MVKSHYVINLCRGHHNRRVLLRSLRPLRAGVLRLPVDENEVSSYRGAEGVTISRLIDKTNKQTENFNSFHPNIRNPVFLQTYYNCLKFFLLLSVSLDGLEEAWSGTCYCSVNTINQTGNA